MYIYIYMRIQNLDCNQIKIFINLEMIGEEKLYLYIFFKYKNLKKKFCNLVKPLVATTAFEPNFYYIVYGFLNSKAMIP